MSQTKQRFADKWRYSWPFVNYYVQRISKTIRIETYGLKQFYKTPSFVCICKCFQPMWDNTVCDHDKKAKQASNFWPSNVSVIRSCNIHTFVFQWKNSAIMKHFTIKSFRRFSFVQENYFKWQKRHRWPSSYHRSNYLS